MSAKSHSLVLLACLLVVGGVWRAHAQDEVESRYGDAIQYRQALMKSLGGHLAAIAKLISGRVKADGHLKVHAAAIAGVTDDVTRFFPEGSTDKDSAAEPEIWKSWDTFVQRAHDNRDAALAFNKIVQAGGSRAEVWNAFKKLTESCKACHKDYRHHED